jgi:multisubunit Na+/H+ antiporter MnhB subunit
MNGQKILDINANVQIAFALTLIVVLLVYIAFYKPPRKKTKKHWLQETSMKKKTDILDANARAIIAFALMMIVLLLLYIAFFK